MGYDKDKVKARQQETIDRAQAKLIANPHLRGYLESQPHPIDVTGKYHSKDWNKLHYCEYVMEKGSHSKKHEIAKEILSLPVADYRKE